MKHMNLENQLIVHLVIQPFVMYLYGEIALIQKCYRQVKEIIQFSHQVGAASLV